MMVHGGAGHGVDTHAHNTAKQQIPGKTGSAGSRHILCQRNDLRLVALFGDAYRDVGVALGLDDARGHTRRRHL
jgi:hypothetical protein